MDTTENYQFSWRGFFITTAGVALIVLLFNLDPGLWYVYFRKLGIAFGAGVIPIGLLYFVSRSKPVVTLRRSWFIPAFVLATIAVFVLFDAILVDGLNPRYPLTVTDFWIIAASFGFPLGAGLRGGRRIHVWSALVLAGLTLIVMVIYSELPLSEIINPVWAAIIAILISFSGLIGYVIIGVYTETKQR